MENPTNHQQLAVSGHQTNNTSVFSSMGAFEQATRMAMALSKSEIVPKTYQGKPENTIIALEMANRMGVSPLMVMQNLDIIHGRPSFNSKFTVAMINGTGKYSPLRYRFAGEGDNRSCVAYAKELATGEMLEGPAVSIKMAKAEGWYTKAGSKWPTMPDLMLSYRAAAFWSRMYEPGLTMGIHTSEEVEDMGVAAQPVQTARTEDLNAKLANRGSGAVVEAQVIPPTPEQKPKAKAKDNPVPAPTAPAPEVKDDEFLPD
jgi:hypothetical protein